MNNHESKYFNTANLFDEALISLLDKKDIKYITIKEICAKAGVNRSTFYLHYENIYDLLKETTIYITKKLVSYYDENPKNFIENIPLKDKEKLNFINEKYLKPYLNFIKDNKNIFITSFNNPEVFNSYEKYLNIEKYIFNPIIDKFNIDIHKRKYYFSFYLNGIFGIIKTWVLGDFIESVDKISDIIIELING